MSIRLPGAGAAFRASIVATIERLHTELTYWPSQQAIRDALGIPRATLRYHLLILEREGTVERLHGGRAVRLTRPDGE